MAEAISFHRKIDSDAVSFHFGVQFTVRDHLAGSAMEEVGGLLFATVLLTEYGDTAEDFDFDPLAGRFGNISHSGIWGKLQRAYRVYPNSVRPTRRIHGAGVGNPVAVAAVLDVLFKYASARRPLPASHPQPS